MLDFNIEYYRTFYYTATLGSMSKAAEAMFVSQPAVSMAIRNLELHLSVKLFVRKTHGMEMTAEGKQLFEHVNTAFGELIAGENELKKTLKYKKETIRIAATETPLYQLLLPNLAAFRKKNPGISISISGSTAADALELLTGRKVDFAMTVMPMDLPDGIILHKGPVFRDVLIAGPVFLKQFTEPVTAREIAEYPLITVAKGTSARDQIDRWFAEKGILFQPAFTVNTSSMILPFVKEDLGIGILPEFFAAPIPEGTNVRILPQAEPFFQRQICIAVNQDIFLPDLCRTFIEELLQPENA
jgi:DNA-binding transcriptional LysR family regulator